MTNTTTLRSREYLYGPQPHSRSKRLGLWRSVRLTAGRAWGLIEVIALLTFPSLAQSAQPTVEALPTFTQARQVLSLTHEEAERGYPVLLRGVVTFAAPQAALWFMQDDTAGIYVYAPDIPLRVGESVEVTGRTGGGGFAPYVYQPKVRALGPGTIPPPVAVSLENLATGTHDSQWVEITGVIRRATEDWGQLLLEISSGSGRVKARVFRFSPAVDTSLVDARVRVRGVAGTHYNEKRQLTGFHLFVPSIDDVIVLKPPPGDPFELPVQTGRSLLSYSLPGTSGHRVRLKGVVLLHRPGQWLILRDSTAGIRAQVEKGVSLTAGDEVDVTGFPTRGRYSPVLTDARYRKVTGGPAPAALRVTSEQASSGAYDLELIELDGTVLHVGPRTALGVSLTLQTEDTVFQAQGPVPSDGDSAASVAEGSRVRVRGVCIVDVNSDGKPTGFDLLLRSANDLAVLAAPPWWTPSRTFAALGLFAPSLLAVCAGFSRFDDRCGGALREFIGVKLPWKSAIGTCSRTPTI